jgi:hypothetical protein
MASKTAAPRTQAAPAKGAPKGKPAKAAPAKQAATGPRARVIALHGGKDKLVDKVAAGLVTDGEDEGALKDRLRKASNQQLLRLAGVVEAVTKAYGSRDELVAALVKALGKAKDKEYVAKLGTFSLPRLYDLARASERRAKAASKKS